MKSTYIDFIIIFNIFVIVLLLIEIFNDSDNTIHEQQQNSQIMDEQVGTQMCDDS